MRDGVQLGRAVEVEGRAEGDPDKKHEPRLDADGGGRTGQGEHGEAGDGGQATDDRHRLAPAGFGDVGEIGDILVRGHAGEQIGERGAHGGHVDDPVQGRAAEPRGDEGQAKREQDGVGRRPVFGVHLDEPRVQEFAAAAGDTPVLLGSGVNEKNAAEFFAVADGAIIGSSFKEEGNVWNPVDPQRVQSFMRALTEAGYQV